MKNESQKLYSRYSFKPLRISHPLPILCLSAFVSYFLLIPLFLYFPLYFSNVILSFSLCQFCKSSCASAAWFLTHPTLMSWSEVETASRNIQDISSQILLCCHGETMLISSYFSWKAIFFWKWILFKKKKVTEQNLS